MKLEKNIVRINGWKNGKRTHVDVEVRMNTIKFFNGEKEVVIEAPDTDSDRRIVNMGFENGLDGVTSYNYWNWVGDERLTVRIW